MNLEKFLESLEENKPPSGLSNLLEALWYDAKGDWEEAHDLVQEEDSADAAWIHAYLHRKEGDLANASYWYSRARKKVAKGDINQEWEGIVQSLLMAFVNP